MASQNLTDALDSIRYNKADPREIQSKVTYSELIPFLFAKNFNQSKIEKNYSAELHRESRKYVSYYDEKVIKEMIDSGRYITTKGVDASPGLIQGKIAYRHETIGYKKDYENVVYLIAFWRPGDVEFMEMSAGCITMEGGATSHAAVTGRYLHIPTITGCSQIKFDANNFSFSIENHTIEEGDEVLVDGTQGIVFFFLDKKQDKSETLYVVNIIDDGTIETLSAFIYRCIQNHEIYSFGLDLAYIVMILKIKNAESLSEVAALSRDFEYLMTIKESNILWVILLPQLKKLCNEIESVIDIEANNQDVANQNLLKTLSRINDIVVKSVDHRHQMTLLENALRQIDNLVYNHRSDMQKKNNINSPKILMVEDEPNYLVDTIQRLKEELNAQITIISNAKDAMDIIEISAMTLDLAIIDLMIPAGKDQNLDINPYKGIEVSKKLKNIRGKNFPIIFLTSVREASILEELSNSTMSRVINKPSLTSSIVETAKDMLRNTNLSDIKLLKTEIQRRKLEVENSDPNSRIRALWALHQYSNHDAEIVSLISKIAEKDANEQVRLTAKKILDQPSKLKEEQFDKAKNKTPDGVSIIIQGNVTDAVIIVGDDNSVGLE